MRRGPWNLPWGTVAKRTSVVTAIFNRAVKKALSCQSLRGPESLQPGTPRPGQVHHGREGREGHRWVALRSNGRPWSARRGMPAALPVVPALQPLLWQPNRFSPRTMLKRVIGRVGVSIADKPFQNMRASCETDWSAQYPTHEFAKWMGHSPAVAAKHYLQSREVHFRSATGSEPWATGCAQEGAESVAPTVQNRLQLASAVDGTGSAHEHAIPKTQRGRASPFEPAQPRAVHPNGRYWIRTSDPTRVMRVL